MAACFMLLPSLKFVRLFIQYIMAYFLFRHNGTCGIVTLDLWPFDLKTDF